MFFFEAHVSVYTPWQVALVGIPLVGHMYTHVGNSDMFVCVCRCSGVRFSQVCRLEDEEVTRMPPVRGGGEIGQTMFNKCRLQAADGDGQPSVRAAQARRSLLSVPRADLQLAAGGFPGLILFYLDFEMTGLDVLSLERTTLSKHRSGFIC